MRMKYPKAKIYEIICNNTGRFYIGSTLNKSLDTRLAEHILHTKKFDEGINKKPYSSFDIIRGGNFKIFRIENYPVDCRKDLLKREGFYIKKFKEEGLNIINKNIAGRTVKEWQEDNKEKIKRYYLENREKKLKASKENYQKNKHIRNEKIPCECGCFITKANMKIHKATKKHNNNLLNSSGLSGSSTSLSQLVPVSESDHNCDTPCNQ